MLNPINSLQSLVSLVLAKDHAFNTHKGFDFLAHVTAFLSLFM